MQAAVSLTYGPAGLSWAEACGAISPNSPFGPLSGSHTPAHLCASSPPESNASHPKPSVLPHAQMLATACRAPAPPFPLLPGNVYGIGCVLLRVSKRRAPTRRRAGVVRCGLLPVDPWAPAMDSQSVASQLFAVSLFPYLGFLYFMTRSKTAPGLTLFGFYFLLAFVGATIPAGIYAKVHYGTSLSNVDWLHGTAESLLTLTNLFIVLGLRGALRNLKDTKESNSEASQDNKEKGSI